MQPGSNPIRLLWLDVAKGLGIVLVVYGHVMRGLIAGGIAGVPWVKVADFFLYLFHMPLFFLLAGLTAGGSLRKGGGTFVKDKLWTIAYPYFLWSLIQGGIQIALGGAINDPLTPVELPMFVLFDPIGQFWFLYALFFCHLGLLLLHRQRAALLVLAALSSVVALTLPDPDDILRRTLLHFGFYAAGVLISARVLRAPSQPSITFTLLLWTLFFAAGYAASLVTDIPMSAAGLPASVLGIAGIIAVAKRMSGPLAKFFGWLGRMSMTIYILHILAGAGTRIVLLKLGIEGPLALHVALGVIVGVGGSVIAHLLFRRLGVLSLLGLAARQRDPTTSERLSVTERTSSA
jgi:fucose 4-O-acetylase-like acetyltransferase